MLQTKRVIKFAGTIEGLGAVEILMAPPAPVVPKAKKGEVDPQKDRREYYELTLGRRVSDEELALLP